MLLPEAVALAALEVLKLSLQLTIKIIDTVPPEQHVKNWERHERIVSAIERLFQPKP